MCDDQVSVWEVEPGLDLRSQLMTDHTLDNVLGLTAWQEFVGSLKSVEQFMKLIFFSIDQFVVLSNIR